MKNILNRRKVMMGVIVCAIAGSAVVSAMKNTRPEATSRKHPWPDSGRQGWQPGIRFFDPKTYKEISNIDVGSKPH